MLLYALMWCVLFIGVDAGNVSGNMKATAHGSVAATCAAQYGWRGGMTWVDVGFWDDIDYGVRLSANPSPLRDAVVLED